MQKYHDEPRQYKGYLKNALAGLTGASTQVRTDQLYRQGQDLCHSRGGTTNGKTTPCALTPGRHHTI